MNQIFDITQQNKQDYYRENNGKFLVISATGMCLGSFDSNYKAKQCKKEYDNTSQIRAIVYHVYFSENNCEYAVESV